MRNNLGQRILIFGTILLSIASVFNGDIDRALLYLIFGWVLITNNSLDDIKEELDVLSETNKRN